MIRLLPLLLGILTVSGCATTTTVSRGATLLAGMHQYQGDMHQAGNSVSRWPERQRIAGNLKTVVTVTVGGSPEFYRLIDLDLRKREFLATLFQTSVRPERAKEMNEELSDINDEIAALKPVIRTQLSALPLELDPQRRVEDAAARALISFALDDFSSNGNVRSSKSTKVGQFTVTDLGNFAIVRAADGQSFRCSLFGAVEDGAGMRCEEIR